MFRENIHIGRYLVLETFGISQKKCQVPISKKAVSSRQPVSQADYASGPLGAHGSLKASDPISDGGLGGKHSQVSPAHLPLGIMTCSV